MTETDAKTSLPADGAKATRPIDAATFNLPGSMTVQPDMPAGRDDLVTQAEALLHLDAKGALFPHGIGGLAREIITRLLTDRTADAAEIERLGKAQAQLQAKTDLARTILESGDQTLRLHMGEMTAQEMRTLRAGFKWVLSSLDKGKTNG